MQLLETMRHCFPCSSDPVGPISAQFSHSISGHTVWLNNDLYRSLSCCPSHRDGKSKSAELGRRAAVLSSAPRSILSIGVHFLLSDSRGSGFVLLLLKSSFSFSICLSGIQLSRLIFNTSAWCYFLSFASNTNMIHILSVSCVHTTITKY